MTNHYIKYYINNYMLYSVTDVFYNIDCNTEADYFDMYCDRSCR